MQIVWLGDSLSSQWLQAGSLVWSEFFAPVQSLNTAVSGHRTTNTLDLIERVGILNDINPKVAMLMIGGNDLQAGAQAPAVIANIIRIIDHIHEKLPHVRVLLMALLPAGGKPDSLIEQGKIINAALALMENGDDIRYLDMQNQFADENENIHVELFQADQLSSAGYQVWQRTAQPLFNELLQFN